MRASVGDRLRFQGRVVGRNAQEAEVLEIRGDDGAPPYLVRFADGRESLVFPGPDCQVERPD